jgi:hypothetical protein
VIPRSASVGVLDAVISIKQSLNLELGGGIQQLRSSAPGSSGAVFNHMSGEIVRVNGRDILFNILNYPKDFCWT